MSDKKYLVLEQHKFNNFRDTWSVKFANLDEDQAFTKLVALRTLNEDKEKIYYIVNMEYLWTKEDKPLVLTDEVKDNQEELPF
jgi:hypothetical protein